MTPEPRMVPADAPATGFCVGTPARRGRAALAGRLPKPEDLGI